MQSPPSAQALQQSFVSFLLEADVLRFGDFTGKSGRKMPYFLDAGRYGRGSQLERLGQFYASTLERELGDGFDLLFGPAYKGIPLVAATSMQLARRGRDVGFCFNRKEAKDHGEGGVLVGQRPKGGDRIVIVEDVTTAGTSVREVMPLLRGVAQVEVVGLIVSVDRQEKGRAVRSALNELGEEFGLRTMSIVTIDEILDFVRRSPPGGRRIIDAELDARIQKYRKEYGAS